MYGTVQSVQVLNLSLLSSPLPHLYPSSGCLAATTVSTLADPCACRRWLLAAASLASASCRSLSRSWLRATAKASASSHSTLNHQSQMKYSWLKMVPLGQRKV